MRFKYVILSALAIGLLIVGVSMIAPTYISAHRYAELYKQMGLPENATTVNLDDEAWDNPDQVGFLSIPSEGIEYPVVQSSDNDKYMRRDYWGNYSPVGNPFLDYRSAPHADNKVIYGHHASIGVVFSSLAQIYKQENFNNLGSAYWTTKDGGVEEYHPLMAMRVYETYGDIQNFNSMTTEQFREWLKDMAQDRSAQSEDFEERINDAKQILVCICCSENRIGQPWRSLVVFVRS